MKTLQENKAFAFLCKKHRINEKKIIETATRAFDLDSMKLVDQEVTLVRTLAIAIEEEYTVLIGQYFDAIHREEKGCVESITEQDFKDCFKLIENSPGNPEFNQWNGSIKIRGRYRLSIQAGSYVYSIPKDVLDSPDDYLKYEIAILDEEKREFVQFSAFVDGVSDYQQVLGWKSLDEILEIANSFIAKLNDGWEVEYA